MEDDRLVARSLAICKSTHCLRTFVLEARQELVELLHAESLEEPLAAIFKHKLSAGKSRLTFNAPSTSEYDVVLVLEVKNPKRRDLHIWPRQLAKSIKA